MNQSESEIVFSSQDLDNSSIAAKRFKPQDHSPILTFDLAKRDPYKNAILSSFTPTDERNSSGKKRSRKSSDESYNDIQARRADQLQKYNVKRLFEMSF